MPLLPNSIPRATNIQQLYDEPLSFLANSRAKLGDIFVLREGGPIFSRAADCAGSVAVFGAANHRALLSDIDVFGLPVSAAEHLSLPANLVNLNRGLHSMRDDQHARHQRLLSALLSERGIEEQHDAVTCGLQTFLEGWCFGQTIPLLAAMRQLALQVSTPLLFGSRYEQRSELASLLQSYFHLRRDEDHPAAEQEHGGAGEEQR